MKRVYVVCEADGIGINVEAVYLDKERAECHCSDSSKYYIQYSELDEVVPYINEEDCDCALFESGKSGGHCPTCGVITMNGTGRIGNLADKD